MPRCVRRGGADGFAAVAVAVEVLGVGLEGVPNGLLPPAAALGGEVLAGGTEC